jgi:adenylate cyclase
MIAPKGKSRRRVLAGLAVTALLAILAALALRHSETFADRVELPLYDALTEALWPWQTGHPDVVLVTIQDASRWPLDDMALADLLETISRGGPSVIAVDLIRDRHLPDDPASPGALRLSRLVLESPNILMVRGIPGDSGADFPPPPFLRDLSDEESMLRIGIAGFPVDGRGGQMIRRSLISIDEGRWFSLPALAAYYHRLHVAPDEAESHVEKLQQLGRVTDFSGGYARLGGGGDQFLLKSGPDLDRCFPVLAAESLIAMDDETLRRAFAGKLIFFGTHAASIAQDEKPVVGHPSLRGIKLLAASTAQLLREMEGREPPVKWSSNLAEILLAVLSALAATLLCWKAPGPLLLRTLVLFPLLALLLLGAAAISLSRGVWLPVGVPLVSSLLAVGGGYAVMFAAERRDKGAIYKLLEKYLSEEVAARIWQNNEALLQGSPPPPEMFIGTALFADLKGYSGITREFEEQGRDRELIDWLNRYLEAVIPAVKESGGFIQQFAGDGIFGIFGFPETTGNRHASSGVDCAKRIVTLVERLNHARPASLPPYLVRVGIYTGEILSGTVGDARQMQLSFLGSTINKAARLESLRKSDHDTRNRPVRVLVSAPTRDAIDEPLLPFGDGPQELDPKLPPELVWMLP